MRIHCAGAPILLVATVLSVPGSARAQGAVAVVRVNLPVPHPVTRLLVSSAETDFGSPRWRDLRAGPVTAAGPVLTITANHRVTVSIGAAPSTTGAESRLPPEVLWALSPAGPFRTLTTTGAPLLSSGPGVTRQPVFFRIHWSATDVAPGRYALEARFTVAEP